MKERIRNQMTKCKNFAGKIKASVIRAFSFVKNKVKQKPIISSIISAALVVVASFGVFLMVSCHITLSSDASFCGVSLSQMDQKQVDEVIEQLNQNIQNHDVSISFHEKTLTVHPGDFNFYYDPKKVFRAARGFVFRQGQTLKVDIEYDKKAFNTYLSQLKETECIHAQPCSFHLNGSSLEVQAGSPGITFNEDQVSGALVEAIKTLSSEPAVAKEEPLYEDCMNIDIDSIYQQVHKEVSDASISIDSLGVLTYNPEQIGVDFSLDEAKEIVTDPTSGSYSIPATITEPKVTVQKLKQQHDGASCPRLISSYTTNFKEDDAGRNFNIQKAASMINGKVFYSGERFSFHDVVGKAGQAQGYQPSTVYTPDGIDTGFGGGICQVSTTTYMAAMLCNLEIQERHNHSYTVNYVSPGLDAAVTDSGPDLKFRNNRKNPIKLSAVVTNNSITISIYGTYTKEENYSVTLDPQIIETYNYETVYRNNPDLEEGKTNTVQWGQNGYRVDTIKTVKRGGVVISTEHIYSRYKSLNKIIEKGTKRIQNTSALTPLQNWGIFRKVM